MQSSLFSLPDSVRSARGGDSVEREMRKHRWPPPLHSKKVGKLGCNSCAIVNAVSWKTMAKKNIDVSQCYKYCSFFCKSELPLIWMFFFLLLAALKMALFLISSSHFSHTIRPKQKIQFHSKSAIKSSTYLKFVIYI